MPELPDVQVFKKYFDATSLHKKIVEVEQGDEGVLDQLSVRELDERLRGRTFTATRRHGKYLFGRFGEEGFLVMHFGMTGFLRAFKNEEKAPDHIAFLIRFEDGYRLAYDCRRRLGHISLTDSADRFIEEKELGPDALALCRDPRAFLERLQGHRGSIKGLLMNQKVLAGIGNVYSDEILFLMGRHPMSRVTDLDDETLRNLAAKTCHILETAIDKGAGAKGWPESWLLPRRRAGRACPRCSGTIKRIKVSGRGTYFCPDHQH